MRRVEDRNVVRSVGFERRSQSTAALATVFVLAVTTFGSGADLPSPSGPYAAGRRVIRWQDPSRREVLSSPADDKRNVVVWLWYPAEAQPGTRVAPYVDSFDRVSKVLSGGEKSLARAGISHSIADAPLAGGPEKFPIVLLSPGAGSIPALYTTFAEDLASHGYVVAAVDHPYDDRVVLLADGRVVPMAKEPSGGERLLNYERERVLVRTQDLQFVLDQLTRMQAGQLGDGFRGRLDLVHAGALGHSVGGMTAAQACREDPRVMACANLDGKVAAMPAYAGPSGDGLDQPFLFMERPLPSMRGESVEAAARRLALLREKGNAVMAGVRRGQSYRITITGATHTTFSDQEALTSKSSKAVELLRVARDLVTAFFDRTLKGAADNAVDRSPTDPAVRIQTFTAH